MGSGTMETKDVAKKAIVTSFAHIVGGRCVFSCGLVAIQLFLGYIV